MGVVERHGSGVLGGHSAAIPRFVTWNGLQTEGMSTDVSVAFHLSWLCVIELHTVPRLIFESKTIWEVPVRMEAVFDTDMWPERLLTLTSRLASPRARSRFLQHANL